MAAGLKGYRFTRQIDTGAGSAIHLAVELKSDRTVAIKHVVRKGPDDDKFLAQAEGEYNICRDLDHPVLRKIHSMHKVRKRLAVRDLYLVMEYVDGLNLEKARPNRLNTFLRVFNQVAMGLHAMHEAGVVHMDIKPTNIMVAKGGSVKIIDFGQSCPMYHRKERIQGTPDYIAPEQVARRPLDRRTDVFNLGATMYWVLTSENYPTEIKGIDAQPGVSVLRSDTPVAPSQLNDKIPDSLSQLVMECCREDPDQRPADMKQVIARLAVVKSLWEKYLERLRTQTDEPTPARPRDASAAAAESDV